MKSLTKKQCSVIQFHKRDIIKTEVHENRKLLKVLHKMKILEKNGLRILNMVFQFA